MTDIVAGVRTAYDRIAETYATVNSGGMPEALVTLAYKLVSHVGRGAQIVDIGCGVGRDSAWFGSRGLRVAGVDLSPGMLGHARRLTSAPLVRMDMRRLAFRDGSFDAAWCAATLLHLPKREAPPALRELGRVLRLDGALMVSIQEGAGESWEGGYVEGVKRFFARYSRPEMEAMLAQSGFLVREVSADRTHRQWLSFLCIAK